MSCPRPVAGSAGRGPSLDGHRAPLGRADEADLHALTTVIDASARHAESAHGRPGHLPILMAGVMRVPRDHSLLFRFEPPEGWPTARSPDVSFRPGALPYFVGAGGPNPPNPMSDRHRE